MAFYFSFIFFFFFYSETDFYRLFFTEKVFLNHASADRMIKVLVLFERRQSSGAINLLKIAEPRPD